MEFSKITESLFIGTTPEPNDYNRLRELGVRLVINMRWEARPFPDSHATPIELLWLPTFDFPLLPIPINKLEHGTRAALAVLKQNGRVYTHCRAGAHRSVAMGAAILIAQGLSAGEAMKLIKAQRAEADPEMWYIKRRIEKFEREWKKKTRRH